jgi:hypothetical protein
MHKPVLGLVFLVACGGGGGSSGADADPSQPDGGADRADAMPAGDIAINEVFAGQNPAGPYTTDWVELVNNTDATVDISGFYLSDDPMSPTKGTIPVGTTIPANGHLRIDLTGVEPYPFGLKSGGEEITFSDASGSLLDRTDWEAGQAGTDLTPVSWGRSPDGTGSFTTLNTPTPGEANLGN